ncbi:MAG: DinB family protein [Saprospiraceae bacterium]
MSIVDHKIKIQFERMDQKKRALMAEIRKLSPDDYVRHPDQLTWSAGQIANHLYLSERLSLVYLKKKLSYPDTLIPYHIKSRWSLFMVNFILWSPFKVRAPASIDMWAEKEVLIPDELDARWNSVRTELSALIAEHENKFGNHLVFNHPFAGRMTMRQMLIFFNHHLAHHLRQINRVLKQIDP